MVVLEIDPMPTPRGRYSPKGRVFNSNKYRKYKNDLAWLMVHNRSKFPAGTNFFVAKIYFKYPVKTKTENELCMSYGDWDNYGKGIQDAMEKAGIVSNDRLIFGGLVMKLRTESPNSRIELFPLALTSYDEIILALNRVLSVK